MNKADKKIDDLIEVLKPLLKNSLNSGNEFNIIVSGKHSKIDNVKISKLEKRDNKLEIWNIKDIETKKV